MQVPGISLIPPPPCFHQNTGLLHPRSTCPRCQQCHGQDPCPRGANRLLQGLTADSGAPDVAEREPAWQGWPVQTANSGLRKSSRCQPCPKSLSPDPLLTTSEHLSCPSPQARLDFATQRSWETSPLWHSLAKASQASGGQRLRPWEHSSFPLLPPLSAFSQEEQFDLCINTLLNTHILQDKHCAFRRLGERVAASHRKAIRTCNIPHLPSSHWIS